MKVLSVVVLAAVGATAEDRLARIEAKLDRLERLLNAVFGEEFKRVEELQKTPGLMEAIRDVEDRHGISGVKEALVATAPEKLYQLQGALSSAVNRLDPDGLKEDESLRKVIVEVMCRMQSESRRGGHLARMIARRDPALLTSCLPDLFARPGATQTALMAASLARGPEVVTMVRAQLPLLTDPGEIVMAHTALLAQGEESSLPELRKHLKSFNDDELLYQMALSLRDGGSPASLWLYLELHKSERFSMMAVSEFSRLRGEKGRPDPMKIRSERTQLYEQNAKWLEENYPRVRFDETRRSFVVEGGNF